MSIKGNYYDQALLKDAITIRFNVYYDGHVMNKTKTGYKTFFVDAEVDDRGIMILYHTSKSNEALFKRGRYIAKIAKVRGANHILYFDRLGDVYVPLSTRNEY